MKYQYADQNMYAQIRLLRIAVAVLLGLLAIAIAGWYAAGRTQRLSLPPVLAYGAELESGQIHSWEVYSFAGYVWQLLQRCESDCSRDQPIREERLSAYLTPRFRNFLATERRERASELQGRSRYLLPLPDTWDSARVQQLDKNRWTVELDVLLVESIGPAEVKRVPIRYSLAVHARAIDPEYNPWGLHLDHMVRPPQRLPQQQ